jgi:hypothetical protein
MAPPIPDSRFSIPDFRFHPGKPAAYMEAGGIKELP